MNITIELSELCRLASRIEDLGAELKDREYDAAYYKKEVDEAKRVSAERYDTASRLSGEIVQLRAQLAAYQAGDPAFLKGADNIIAKGKAGELVYVECIKQVRSLLGLGLKEAKQYVDKQWPERVRD